MSQNIINQTERQVSMLQFAVIFLGSLFLACFVLFRTMDLNREIPEEELRLWKEKAPVLKALGDLGDKLRDYETAIQTNSPAISLSESRTQSQATNIYTMLAGKDKNPEYKDIFKILAMSDQYKALLRKTSSTDIPEKVRTQNLTTEVQQLRDDKDDLTSENRLLKQEKSSLQLQLNICQQRGQ